MGKRLDAASKRRLSPASDDESEKPGRNAFRAHLQRYAFPSSVSASPQERSSANKKCAASQDTKLAGEADMHTNSEEHGTATTDKRFTINSPPMSTLGILEQQPSRKTSTSPFKRPRSTISVSRKPPPLAIENKLVDSLRPNLILVMIGVNPSRTTALTGHSYSHKSNRYWPTMHAAGVTPILHPASDTALLQDLYGIGHTNIVSRPTVTESDIHHHEFMEGAAILDEKIRVYRPAACAVVGKGIWMRWVEWKTGRKGKELNKGFQYGWQDEDLWIGRTISDDDRVVWQGARTIVVATTSGAAAQFAANGGERRIELWRPLGEWFRPKREEWMRNNAR